MTEHIWKITFSICLLRENTRQENVCTKCLCKKMFATKVSARTDSKMATQINVYFFKQRKTKQNLIWYSESLKHNKGCLIAFFCFQIVVLTFWKLYLSSLSQRSGQLHLIARSPKKHYKLWPPVSPFLGTRLPYGCKELTYNFGTTLSGLEIFPMISNASFAIVLTFCGFNK